MKKLMEDLFPLNRSITGDGVRQTIAKLQEHIPLKVHEVPSGTKVFDWDVPAEWVLNRARLIAPDGSVVCDTNDSNLHVVGYSEPMRATMDLEELRPHLHTMPERPHAVQYVTSYYESTWGFCISHETYENLNPGTYIVDIDTAFTDGSLTYADLVIPGETTREVLFSTYTCHPSLCSNELSGPVVLTELVKWLRKKPRHHTYRILFAPETIGALAYMASTPAIGFTNMLGWLQQHVRAGWVLTCLGGPGSFTLQCGRTDNYATRISRAVLSEFVNVSNFHPWELPWSRRASDERQWCAPGVDLPVCSIRKTNPPYPEYHNSDDNLEYVTEEQLEQSLGLYKSIVRAVEADRCYEATTIGEPMMSKRGLYATTSMVGSSAKGKSLLDVWGYCDGRSSLEIANVLGEPLFSVQERLAILNKHGLVKEARARESSQRAVS